MGREELATYHAKRDFSRARPTVSLPTAWPELAAATAAGDPGALLAPPHEALERVADTGNLFAPVLSVRQRLP